MTGPSQKKAKTHENDTTVSAEKSTYHGIEQQQLPDWVAALSPSWGEPLDVGEWKHDGGLYRQKHGWMGTDLVHDADSPVRVFEYRVNYGEGINDFERGGVGTTMSGVAHFTKRAESHRGYCHGGSMCSLMDDAVGWVAFLTTGSCRPWSGFTAQINTSLKNPIPVGSFLLVQATITKVERRKVYIAVEISNPHNDTVHATCEGLAILNRGILTNDT